MSYCRNPIFFGTAACNQVPDAAAAAAIHSASDVMRTFVELTELTLPVLSALSRTQQRRRVCTPRSSPSRPSTSSHMLVRHHHILLITTHDA